MQGQRVVARRLVAVGCVVAGTWLLTVGVVYADWTAIAVALVSVMFGVHELRAAR